MTSEEMARLHAQSFPARPWSAREIDDLCRADTVQSFVSPGDDGLLLVRVLPPESEILTLAVATAARRRGIGWRLLADWIDDMGSRAVTDLYLEVAADNVAALALYDRHRFRPAGRRPGYYSRPGAAPVDAVLMHRAVAPGPAAPHSEKRPRIG